MLGDFSVPQFYPSLFVLITELLDSFAELVYDRILSKGFLDADGHTCPLPGPVFSPFFLFASLAVAQASGFSLFLLSVSSTCFCLSLCSGSARAEGADMFVRKQGGGRV